ncbi:thiosulfate oxidation carrier complex protein SoxZ [Pseudorhodoferax sp. Leaf265]|jgi:sulfur-oxidizing protein SoxZ|uniref:thiosulfate oxidation carrier complex protein SoxZ n=1 Tax=Pseudorhodoferax sp. Leaf265 TaxID=1736315 RepID=UPI000701669B|nr:thiosulfate oxidation carrier complex protein SoxZ [Pseudorhodoferax sp. Leaf265]KQP19902.1 thiosulfate oxidation carrier complex protein SoxZ [Pseudorhodoferax sp. Leaf265]PZP93411.1 MAG: thiosulfate oxidation carrier complex protein SoxZ [Variovorax paradoxus]PZQ03987.1 MAG: thiosulfate oxidation carrier complex protein SoxZ [Variovorax paradoxus]
MARTLIHVPPSVRRGEPFEVRTTIAHPMETGYRPDENGRVLPRDIVTRLQCTLDGALVFSADLYPAIAANPYMAFQVRAERSGELRITWEGDKGFSQTETVAVRVE